jgi:septal ring factor EnvC (AmiA/AmiB activator)
MRIALIVASILGLAHAAAADPRTCQTSFIVVSDAHDVLMSGDSDDVDRVRKALPAHERAVWTRTADCKEYVVRDGGVVDEIQRDWKPTNALAEQLGKLGDQQGKLGEQMGKLGEKEGKLGERVGELALRSVNATEAQRPAIEREMRDLEGQMRDIEKQMKVFEKPMKELEKPMREIERKLKPLAKQAEADTYAVLARAIASGTAKPFP